MSSEEEVRITLRLPANLRDALVVSAAQNSRSMNSEIVSRLIEFESLTSKLAQAETRIANRESLLSQARAKMGRFRDERDLLIGEKRRFKIDEFLRHRVEQNNLEKFDFAYILNMIEREINKIGFELIMQREFTERLLEKEKTNSDTPDE